MRANIFKLVKELSALVGASDSFVLLVYLCCVMVVERNHARNVIDFCNIARSVIDFCVDCCYYTAKSKPVCEFQEQWKRLSSITILIPVEEMYEL
jgi:hypothetical protein